MTGVYASAVFYQLRKERFIPVKTQICGVLASFVFCADVIAAIAGYRICVRGGKMCDGSSTYKDDSGTFAAIMNILPFGICNHIRILTDIISVCL